MESATTQTQYQYVLKCNSVDNVGFLGFVKDNPDKQLDVLVLESLQDAFVAVYTDKEKAETSKQVLINSGTHNNLSIVEIETDPNTHERREM